MKLGMGIIKVEIKIPELRRALDAFKTNRMSALEMLVTEIKESAASTFNQLLNAEMTVFLGSAEQSENKRNGFEIRDYALKGIGSIRVRVPVDRKRKFASDIIPSREQIDPRLKEDLAVLHLAGISTRTLAMISKRILGVEVGKQTISNSLAVLEPKALQWLERPLTKDYWALFIDGTNFRIQRRGSTEKEPSLVVIGIDDKNRLSILAIQPGLKDNADSWREVFSDLIKRGLKTKSVRIGVMDGLPGLETAFKETFTAAVTGRCWVHALRNALAKTPERLREAFHRLATEAMTASSENAARIAFSALKTAMGNDAGRAVHCLEKDLDSLLAHYKFDKQFWRVLRTTNPIERVNKELKRRTKSMETIGEKTLMVLVAFTAMRLEFNWLKVPVDAPALNNLKFMKDRKNVIESTMETMLH
jgi:transposase-like protein